MAICLGCLLFILVLHSNLVPNQDSWPRAWGMWMPVVIAPRTGVGYSSPRHTWAVLMRGVLLTVLFFSVSTEWVWSKFCDAGIWCMWGIACVLEFTPTRLWTSAQCPVACFLYPKSLPQILVWNLQHVPSLLFLSNQLWSSAGWSPVFMLYTWKSV